MSDNGMSFFYWWLIILLPVFLIAGRSRRSMKPRVRLDADEFLRISDKAEGKVIRVSPASRLRPLPPFLQRLFALIEHWIGTKFPWMYVLEGKDYYYYTRSK